MKQNPLQKLSTFGQSIWLDYIRRQMIDSGELQKLIEDDGLKGVTSNPAIFEKAIAGSRDYDDAIRTLARAGKSVAEIYQVLTVEDVQRAADLFRPLYDRVAGKDGFISLEVNPHLAHDTQGTLAEARHLWQALGRPNVLIKVPATKEGLPAVRQLISEGINVNVTLLFGLPRYREVAEAYIAGLEDRAATGKPLNRVASVASFFLSRIDVLLDPQLEAMAATGGPQAQGARDLIGQMAIASAKVAYTIYREIFGSARFQKLADQGARPQRLLWASTSTKNPAYPDVKYVEPLIGPDTVNTLPPETLEAYRDHGDPAPRLTEGVDRAAGYLQRLPELGLDLNHATQQLEDEGVDKFNKPFDALLATLEGKRREVLAGPVDRQTFALGAYEGKLEARLARMAQADFGARLWHKDASLWKQNPRDQKGIPEALGWLTVAETMAGRVAELTAFAQEVRQAGLTHVVHMGMGGSSLAPLALARTFPLGAHGLPLTVLDTTDPATIKRLEDEVPLHKTLFIVASKSGTTAEPQAFMDYFYDRLLHLGEVKAGDNFVAITDAGSLLARQAQERGFRRTFINFTDIGGRYSALSYFGLVPAALMGLDVAAFLDRAIKMMHACGPNVLVRDNPGLVLGAILGELATHGRDKVTFVVPAPLASLGMWLEQLLAESTGKEGTGLLPLWGRPGLGVPAAGPGGGGAPGPGRGRAGRRRPAGGHHPDGGPAGPGPGVFPLGDRHRHRRRHPGHQRLQPTQRPGEQGQYQPAAQSGGGKGATAGGTAVAGGGPRQPLYPGRRRRFGHREPAPVPGPGPARRLPGPPGLLDGRPGGGCGPGRPAPHPPGPPPLGHHPGLRPPLPPLHRPAPQGRPQHRHLLRAHRR
jgi:transaldolase/glucose-6-phosphate isomerase